jgi:hypothetical protein
MAITYKHYLWNGTDGYLNLDDGVTARIRVKKLDDGDEVKNLDHNLLITDLTALSQVNLQSIIDNLIAADAAFDAAELAKKLIIIPPIDAGLNTKVKQIKTNKKA